MLALRILDLKDFTGKLFIGEMFQHFSFVEASFTTFVTYTLDGQLHKEFFDSEQDGQCKVVCIHKLLEKSKFVVCGFVISNLILIIMQ